MISFTRTLLWVTLHLILSSRSELLSSFMTLGASDVPESSSELLPHTILLPTCPNFGGGLLSLPHDRDIHIVVVCLRLFDVQDVM